MIPAAASFRASAIGADLHPREDEHRAFGFSEVLDQPFDLRAFIDDFGAVADALRRLAAMADLHELGLADDLQRKPHHIVGHRCREEQRLTDRGHRRDDLADIRPEAHVHHAIGFIEHEQRDAAQVGVLLTHVIDEPARSGHDDVDARFERAFLHAHFDTAVNRGARDRRVVREAVDFVFDLNRELTRGREHHHAALDCAGKSRCVSGGADLEIVGQQSLDGRNDERGGLARAGLGARNQVVSFERERNHRALDRTRFAEAEVANAFKEPGIEAERCESDRRRVADGRFESRRGGLTGRVRLGDVVRASACAPARTAGAMTSACIRIQIILASAPGR